MQSVTANPAVEIISDQAIINGLSTAGREHDEQAVESIRTAIRANHFVTDDGDAELFAQSFQFYGNRAAVIDFLDDALDEPVSAITGCTSGEQLLDLYLGTPSVDASDLYEVYFGDSEEASANSIIFVCSVI